MNLLPHSREFGCRILCFSKGFWWALTTRHCDRACVRVFICVCVFVCDCECGWLCSRLWVCVRLGLAVSFSLSHLCLLSRLFLSFCQTNYFCLSSPLSFSFSLCLSQHCTSISEKTTWHTKHSWHKSQSMRPLSTHIDTMTGQTNRRAPNPPQSPYCWTLALFAVLSVNHRALPYPHKQTHRNPQRPPRLLWKLLFPISFSSLVVSQRNK